MKKEEINILVVFSEKDDKNRCSKITTIIQGIKNQMPVPSILSYDECRQSWRDGLKRFTDSADIILLLMSLEFVGFEHYREDVELFLRRHQQEKSTVIPVLLSSSGFEWSSFQMLQPLPSDARPITRWSNPDRAFDNIATGLRRTIYQMLKKRGVVLESDAEELDQEDTLVSPTAFTWTENIHPLDYLTLSTTVDQEKGGSRLFRLRMIGRFIYEQQKDSYGEIALNEQEIFDGVKQKFPEEYSLQDCQQDLKYLVQKGNLFQIDDLSNIAYSIPAFEALLQRKLYRATDDGFEIERLIENRIHISKGRLSKNDLREIKENLLIIDRKIQEEILREEEIDAIEENWHSVFKKWNNFTESAWSYFSTLEQNSAYQQYDFESYMAYKDLIIRYIRGFADTLLTISHEINDLFFSWSPKKNMLVRLIAESERRKIPKIEEEKPPLEECIAQIHEQMTKLENWFRLKSPRFCERAATEIHRIVNRAASLALYQRLHINNVSALSNLAANLMDVSKFEAAQQLFETTFTLAPPLYCDEQIAGHAQFYEYPEKTASVWDEPPSARLSLVPKKQRPIRGKERSLDIPVREDRQKIYALQMEALEQETKRQQRFNRLFALPTVDLASFSSIEPDDRSLLEEVIDSCLNHPAHRYQDEMGKTILLLNPFEQRYTHLCSSDGTLFLPCYRLALQDIVT